MFKELKQLALVLVQRAERRWRGTEAAYQDLLADRTKAERALRESHQHVEDLARRLLVAQEGERKRLARDLHDDLSQKLALLAIEVDLLPRPQGVIGDRVKEIAERVAEIAADVHGLAYQLHPSKLEMLGLVAAIHGLCRDTVRHYGVKVDFESRDVPRDIGSDVALCLYRIVQEALQNIVKHSGAGRASLRLAWADGVLDLHIADPGRGFVTGAREPAGIGVVSMRERANIVGGQMVIHSAPGRGTRIGVRVRVDDRPPRWHRESA